MEPHPPPFAIHPTAPPPWLTCPRRTMPSPMPAVLAVTIATLPSSRLQAKSSSEGVGAATSGGGGSGGGQALAVR